MKQLKQVIKQMLAALVAMAFTTLWAQQVIKIPRLVRMHTATDSVRVERDTIPLPLSLPGMLIEGRDTLSAKGNLEIFFSGLDSLRAGKDTVMNIVHLGDSHIQAGYYSGEMMHLLHAAFGNAGRGWIAPLKLSRSNEAPDYFIKSVIRSWNVGRITQRESRRRAPVGLGGVGIQSVSPSINFDVIITPKNGAGYEFNEAILYRGARSMPMLPAGKNKQAVETFLSDTVLAEGVIADTFRIIMPVDTLQLQSTRRKQGTDRLLPASTFRNVYYGFSLKNGKPGILYHAVGINGVMYVNYTDSAYIAQLALLKPDLLIVSMGTNETFGRRFRAEEFAMQVKAFLSLVKAQMPQAAILLTTPPECYKRVTVNKKRVFQHNTNTEQAAETLIRVAKEEGIACWDLFSATGGKNSCRKWLHDNLLRRDRIHFTQAGYEEQATLLFRALMNEYNRTNGK